MSTSDKTKLKDAADAAAPLRANPFLNATRRTSCCQKLKIAFCLIFQIVTIRILLIFICLLFAWLLTKLATCGFRPVVGGRTQAMGCFRTALLAPARWLVRVILFIFGVYWISEKYPKTCCYNLRQAPIIVCNHVSYFDALYFGARVLPAAVAKSAVANYPIVGSIIKAMQPILVYRSKRTDGPKRKGALEQIMERVELAKTNPAFPPILIFPEGTTHNTTALTMFKRGAFVPAAPVQPVVIKYPFCFHDVSWTPDASLVKLVIISLCQFYQRIEVEYLPVYTPSGKELSNPALYGKNVRALMAQALDVPVTNHAFEDVRLLDTVSRKYGLQHIVPVMNVADARNTMQLDYAGVSNLLKRFREADTDNSGNLGFEEFCTAMQLDTDAEYARRLFDCVDSDGDGSIDFREVVVGLSFTAENASTDAKLKMAFQVYDQNGDGFITKEELHHVLATVQKLDDNLAGQEVAKVLGSVSTNDEGRLSFQEFKSLASGDNSFLSMAVDMARLRAGLPTMTPKLLSVTVQDDGEAETKPDA